jgi:hypothetical protein
MDKTIVLLALSLALAAPTFAGPPLQVDHALALMSRPGSWIEAAGDLQADGTLLTKEVEIYSEADSAELEEASIYGAVTRLDLKKGAMRVIGYNVSFDGDTTIKDDIKRVIDISRIQEGQGIKVQGRLQSNGRFAATKIKLQGDKTGKGKVKEKVFGPVRVVDARAGLLRVLNTPVKLRPDATLWEAVVQQ